MSYWLSLSARGQIELLLRRVRKRRIVHRVDFEQFSDRVAGTTKRVLRVVGAFLADNMREHDVSISGSNVPCPRKDEDRPGK